MRSIDVIIPAFNGMPEIKECIRGLLDQSVKVGRIIVIDSGSTDGTLEFLSGIPEVRILKIEPSEFNHGHSRNLGCLQSDSEFLLMTVQDARPMAHDMLQKLLSGFADEKVAGVCGQQVVCPDPRNNPLEWHRPVNKPLQRRYELDDPGAFQGLPPEEKYNMCRWDNVVALYRRKSLLETPFRGVSFGEDMLWASEVLQKGGSIVYQPEARICHFHMENHEVMLRRSISIMYYRHLHFGYVYPRPDLSLKLFARVVRYTLFNPKVPFGRRFFWMRYNMTRLRADAQAWELFEEARMEGGTSMDRLYEKWVKPHHSPLKRLE